MDAKKSRMDALPQLVAQEVLPVPVYSSSSAVPLGEDFWDSIFKLLDSSKTGRLRQEDMVPLALLLGLCPAIGDWATHFRDLCRECGCCPSQGLDVVGFHCVCNAVQHALQSTGLLQGTMFLSNIHRWRNHQIRSLHPLGSCASLADIMSVHEISKMVTSFVDMPSASSMWRTSHGLSATTDLSYGTFIYLCGGYCKNKKRTLDSVERFCSEKGSWEPLPPMGSRRQQSAVAALGGRVYVCGGRVAGCNLRSAECFVPLQGRWDALPPMSAWRYSHSAICLGGLLYVCGGNYNVVSSAPLERFSPTADTWEIVRAPMQEERLWPAVAALAGDLYLCGGKNDASGILRSVEKFARGQWHCMPPMIEQRKMPTAVVAASRLYICGGSRGHPVSFLSAVERFDPSAGTWEALPSMLEARYNFAAASVAGCVYVCGGISSHQSRRRLSSVERFDPSRGNWELVAPMARPRGGLTVLAFSKCLYACDGEDGEHGLNFSERFDVQTGTWEALPPIEEDRGGLASASVVRLNRTSVSS